MTVPPLTQLPYALYAFGNRQQPRLPRPNKDILLVNDRVFPTEPPTGASTFAEQQFQIQKTTPVTRLGVNSKADSASPLKRTEPGKIVHLTHFNGFSL
jgi:hypothetical protein